MTPSSGSRCKALVPLANALHFPRGGGLPFYCDAHQEEILAQKPMLTVPFRAFIPQSLELRTQVVLRHLMRKTMSDFDGPGYIYALELIGNAHPDLIRIKLGRTNDVARRLWEHRRCCPSSHQVLLGQTGLVPYCDRLERLIHVELTDRAAQSNPAGRTAPRTRCTDCYSVHTEIFTLRRLHGRNYGSEWHLIVRPIVQKWAHFVSLHVI
ncbi:hypothetical protein LXA43DRAFT_893348 [Ganoderma leucocontextum]|nr:hypothetical protein LXA43DRAFT_893348 [Ganoderma leucocontextum]